MEGGGTVDQGGKGESARFLQKVIERTLRKFGTKSMLNRRK
jgi:hypothetical protein